ncbi:MAG: SigB/SigF/SigG family RNA polymerase sigma factor [Erysipelotrichales bacterium]|nr:SigB/SigF/SigG family RNA polymerase sigma factor [Erysipelotrichales bacterium]
MSKYKVNINGVDTSNLVVLTKEEMAILLKEFKNGSQEAKEKIINGNLKLVLSIINKYNNGKNDMNDLFQIGCIGLIKAVDNFDDSYGVMFSTYAVPLILGEVKRYIRDSTSIRITRSVRDRAYQIMKFKDEYMTIHGVEPSIDEITKSLDITEYELASAMDSLKDPVSIYEPIYNDGGDTIYLLDQLADTKEVEGKKDDLISLRKALTKLKEREKEILIDRYIVGKTQMELASELGVSQAQISRIEKNAINNIKKLIK